MIPYYVHKNRIYPLPVVIRATGKIEVLKYEESQLLSLQKAVDGYIEVVPLPGDPGLVLIADEEGLFKKKPLNLLATEMVRSPIVGDVVLMERKQLD
jgi:hypothetical protein